MFKSIKIKEDADSGNVKISSRPQSYAFILSLAIIVGLSVLPFTEYRNDYLAYIALVFVFGLTIKYFMQSTQSVTFENKTHVKVRKGFITWVISFDSVSGGYTSYKKKFSRQSSTSIHFLSFELRVDLPDNSKHWIRNGKANIFHYGFDQWGKEQEKIWAKFNEILDKNGIPNLTTN